MTIVTELVRFAARLVANNLLPALVAGAIAWLLVLAGVRLFDIRHGKLRLCLFLAPPVKSTLVLLGLVPVLPWPRDVFGGWAAAAVAPAVMVPIFLVAAGASFLVHARVSSRERAAALADAVPAEERSPRLAAAHERVEDAFAHDRQRIAVECGCAPPVEMPSLRVTRRDLGAPLVVLDERPVIVFPEALIERLDDGQLEGALAHEAAHLHVRRRLSCTSSELVRRWTAINPFALAVASQLELEEEKACDDMAVAVTGDRASYADMLLAAYRHSAASGATARLTRVPHLMGLRPALVQRVERQLGERGPGDELRRQQVGFWLLWCALVLVVFNG